MTQTKTYASEYDRFLAEANWIIDCDKRSPSPAPYFSKNRDDINPFLKATQIELEYFYSYREATNVSLDEILTPAYYAEREDKIYGYEHQYRMLNTYDAYNNSVDLYLSKGP